MKIGYIGDNFKNRILDRDERELVHFGASSSLTTARLFPDDDFARINPFEPDIDLCNRMDMVFIGAGPKINELCSEWAERITSIKILHIEGGYNDFTSWPIKLELNQERAMELCDFVMCMDYRYMSLFEMWTDTPILYWPLPYPVHDVLRVIAEKPVTPVHDIAILYGPSRFDRNGILMCRLAKKILGVIMDWENVAVFSWRGAESEEHQQAIDIMNGIGFRPEQYTMYAATNLTQFITILLGTKLMINLDDRRAWGKVAIESALCRVPVIASDCVPTNYALYGDIRIQDSHDIDAAMDTARLVASGGWKKEWLDRAYNKALGYAIDIKAKELEERINGS